MGSGRTSSLAAAKHILGTDPAANTEISEVVPAGKQWELAAVSVSLVQGITQTPQPILQILTPSDAVDAVQTITLDAVPAGGAVTFTFTPPSYYTAGAGPFTSASIDGTANITAAEVQTALRTIAGLEAVTVGGSNGGPFTVTFTGGAVGGRPISPLVVAANTITPATGFTIVTQTEGVQGGVLWEGFGSSAAQAVSTTCRYNWASDLSLTGQIGATTNVHSNAPIPELLLQPGMRVKTSTIGKGANSDYGAPSLYVVEYG